MELNPSQLANRLGDLSRRCFLVHGPETLLIEESRDLLRRHFAGLGYEDAGRHVVERGFDWSLFSRQARSPSLFASRRYLELRLPKGLPADGAAPLAAFVADPAPDVALVVVCGRLDKRQLGASLGKAFERDGVVVNAGSVAAARLPAWLRARFRAHGVECDEQAAARLAWYVEGNLLAADQEVRKLALLLPGGAVLDAATLERVAADQSRFNVFAFADACVAGDGPRAARILRNLRRQGMAPILPHWSLVREVRALCLIGAALRAGENPGAVYRRHRVWSSRVALLDGALKRLPQRALHAILSRLAILDVALKGQGRLECGPDDAWVELESICLAICGITCWSRRRGGIADERA